MRRFVPLLLILLGAGPAMDDEAFFAALDLSRPDLAEVKAAADQKDWPAAKHAFVQHLKTRTSPKWHFNWKNKSTATTRPSENELRDADRYARNELIAVHVWHDFKDHIDWNSNPMENQYNEWTWQLNRHDFWVVLGKAYWASGDEKYAKAFVSQLNDWIRSQPCPETNGNKPYSSWRTIETGLRAFRAWPNAFYYFLSSPSFDDESIVLMVKSLADHADHLMKWPQQGNWLTMESNGLYHIGVLFPEYRDAGKWRETAITRLYAELDKQVYPDGGQVELSPSYHDVALNSFELPVKLAKLNDHPIPADYVAKLERMYDYDVLMSMPNRRLPPLGDSDDGPLKTHLKIGAEFFPQRADWQWILSDGKQGSPSKKLSCEFPYAGYYVLRSGWDNDARYLLLDAGPFGYGHQHEDKLTVIAAAYGKVHLIDPGNYPYDTSQWRKYAIDTFAHNTVLVDGQPQHRRGEKDRWNPSYVVKVPQPHVFSTSAAIDYASGTYDEGYGENKERIATHRRQVIYVKSASSTRAPGEYWVIVDTFEPNDDLPHTYDAMFHLDADAIEIGRRSLIALTKNKSGSNFAIVPITDRDMSATDQAGQKKPFVQGWTRKGDYGMRPIPTPVYHKQAAGPARMIFVLYPLREGEPMPITGMLPLGAVIEIYFGRSGVDRLELTGNGATIKGFR